MPRAARLPTHEARSPGCDRRGPRRRPAGPRTGTAGDPDRARRCGTGRIRLPRNRVPAQQGQPVEPPVQARGRRAGVDRQELPRQAAADPRGHHRPGSRRAGALPPADRRPDQFRPHSKRGDTLMSMHVLSASLAALLATVSMPGHSQAAAPAAPVTDAASQEDPAMQAGRELSQLFLQGDRSEEHTSELQSLMRNSYAVFCLKKKKETQTDRIKNKTDSITKDIPDYITR